MSHADSGSVWDLGRLMHLEMSVFPCHIPVMTGWCIKTITPPDLVQLYVVAEPDQVKAYQIISALVDGNVIVQVAGQLSARNIEILGLQTGKVLNITS